MGTRDPSEGGNSRSAAESTVAYLRLLAPLSGGSDLTAMTDPRRPRAGMRDRVAQVLFSSSAPRRTEDVVGRYRVLDELGRGGMGVVVRAHDPKLRREVALKIMRVDRLGTSGQARMIREARAMARLSHPNVVTVHDVELDGPDGVVVVMEYVDGQTLHEWLWSERRSWSSIVSSFVAAGQGLAAAHAAGLLHRDFKPSNVLVGADGRVRVADFGLARAPAEDSASRSQPGPTPDRASAGGASANTSGAQLTTCGTLLGTPDFMAPELLRGEEASERSDQYAFCVSLWWALAGSPPFAAGGEPDDKDTGPPGWSSERPVPRRIVAALQRGLQADPGQRWPSMPALLHVLSESTRHRGRWIVAGGMLMLGAIGTLALVRGPATSEPRCDGNEQIASSWGPQRRDTVRRNLQGASVPYADRAWSRAEARLDQFSARWGSMYEQACEATVDPSGAIIDVEPVPVLRCLQRSRAELEATVTRLAEPSAPEHVGTMLDGLPDLDRCRSAEITTAPPAPEADETEAVEALHRRLAQIQSLRLAGQYDKALEALEQAEANADTLRYGPIRTMVWKERGELMSAMGRYPEATEAYAQTQEHGVRWEQWSEVAAATRGRLYVVGTRLGRPQEATLLADLARGFAARTNDQGDLALTLSAIGQVQRNLGEFEVAEQHQHEAIALWTELHGEDDENTARMRTELAIALAQQGHYAPAEEQMQAVLEIRTRMWGDRHPLVASSRTNLASVLMMAGRRQEGQEQQRLALELNRELLSDDHPSLALSYYNVAAGLAHQGRVEESEQHYLRALAIYERAGLGDSVRVAKLRGNLATVYLIGADYEPAEPLLRQAIATLTQALGPEHPSVAWQRRTLGSVLTALGQHEEAEREFTDALRITRAAVGPEHPEVAMIHGARAILLRQRHEDAAALAEIDAELAIRSKAHDADHPELARTHLQRGGVLYDMGRVDEAEREFQQTIDAVAGTLEPGDWTLVSARVGLGLVALQRGDHTRARALLEEQWMLAKEIPGQSGDEARMRTRVRMETGSALVQALWEDRAQRSRAQEIARRVLADERAKAYVGQREHEQLARWVAEHGGSRDR